ncbi:protein LIAT1 [Notolabrus celidotus]|uniref:protein LIAT1 n=1 Tax=Notolabrus celidotus TaxID=1203425 RepID=UPI0014900581|nr:protein LIAT1 [Notolabrus celidotus]
MPPEMVASLLPPQSPGQPRGQLPKLRDTRKKDGKRLSSSGCRRKKKQRKDSSGLLKNKSSLSGEAELSAKAAKARESLRWEGALEDPQAEEKRLELYRANRRQRYVAHRQDSEVTSTQRKDKKASGDSEQQVVASLLHLRLK